MNKELIFPMSEQYEEYLIDESKLKGYGESISFPESEMEMIEILKKLYEENVHVTVQGGKTGIVGGAVPLGGHVMNLSRMNNCGEFKFLEDGTGLITVEAGMNLMDLKKEIARLAKNNPLFWPPEPTESSATVGGVAACNAKGICSCLYGDTKQYIAGVHLVHENGKLMNIERDDSGLLDSVLGSEGILGAFSQLTLKLIPKPAEIWGISFFFEDKYNAARFADEMKKNMPLSSSAEIAAVEYIDRHTIDIVENRKSLMSKLKDFPDIEPQFQAMLYLELHGIEEGILELAEKFMELAAEFDSDPEKAWAVSGETEIEKMRAFRHGAAETANLLIEEARKADDSITKLGGDMCVEGWSFEEVLRHYEEGLEIAGIPYCIFGHALGNHLHVNILPTSLEEYLQGQVLLKTWAEEIVKLGGKIICEHGMGKLKKNLFHDIIDGNYLHMCKTLKSKFDPCGLYGKGTIL